MNLFRFARSHHYKLKSNKGFCKSKRTKRTKGGRRTRPVSCAVAPICAENDDRFNTGVSGMRRRDLRASAGRDDSPNSTGVFYSASRSVDKDGDERFDPEGFYTPPSSAASWSSCISDGSDPGQEEYRSDRSDSRSKSSCGVEPAGANERPHGLRADQKQDLSKHLTGVSGNAARSRQVARTACEARGDSPVPPPTPPPPPTSHAVGIDSDAASEITRRFREKLSMFESSHHLSSASVQNASRPRQGSTSIAAPDSESLATAGESGTPSIEEGKIRSAFGWHSSQ